MPQFRFRVVTPDGRVRSGRFTGNSEEEARKQIESAGMNVLELTLLESEAPAVALPRPPGWVSRLNGYWVAAALAGAGLIWGVYSWRQKALHPAVPPARTALEMADKRFQGAFRVEYSGSTSPQAVLLLNFPEVPYQVSRPWSRGQEACAVDFLAARTPSYCLISLQDGAAVLGEARVEPVLPSNEVQLHIR
ncbi:MAG: hypothetical protein KF760_19560 [Candidatus Eremiobacteraeota bacterium]|nr:hypothetical protein [Candidatus Eremiobacteraeota bacterium]MCW5868769.1 hypothetical protein [Candidatus Eremiobacteraeota bacterium]